MRQGRNKDKETRTRPGDLAHNKNGTKSARTRRGEGRGERRARTTGPGGSDDGRGEETCDRASEVRANEHGWAACQGGGVESAHDRDGGDGVKYGQGKCTRRG